MAGPLDYQSRPPLLPKARSEFDHAYDAERGRWLRRRFLIYIGICIAISLPWLVPGCAPAASDGDAPPLDPLFLDLSFWLGTAIYVVAFVWAWRRKPKFGAMIRLAVALFVIGGAWTVVFCRWYMLPVLETEIAVRLQEAPPPKPKTPVLALESFDENGQLDTTPIALAAGTNADFAALGPSLMRDREQGPSLATAPPREPRLPRAMRPPPTTGPALQIRVGDETLDPSKPISAVWQRRLTLGVLVTNWWMLAAFLLINHLLMCLFIPWKVRESVMPTLLVLLLAAAVVVSDAVLFQVPALMAGPTLLALAFTAVPGTAVNWWRYSRFNHRFKLHFESSRYRQLQHELDGARQIHEVALPAPKRDGPVRIEYVYEPMRHIGGDMLFVHHAPGRDDLCSVVLLDVTGHGIAAALTVNRILGEIERSYAERPDASPESVLRNLNRYLHLTLSRHAIFVTAIVMRIDAREETIEYVNAGHPTAFMCREGKPCDHLESTAMILGATDDADFFAETMKLRFASGDAVLAYTDGASEAADDRGRMLRMNGVERLVHDVARHNPNPAQWPALVLDGVIRHREALPQDDTLVVAVYRA